MGEASMKIPYPKRLLRSIEVERVKWENWDGALPTTVMGGDSGMLPIYSLNPTA